MTDQGATPTPPSRFPHVFYALAVLFALPVFLSRFLPFPDYPLHVGELHVLANATDPTIAPYYDVESAWWHPYTPHRLLLLPLTLLVGAELAYRLFLLVYLLGVPLAALALVRRTGRSPWLALLIFAVLYSYPFVFGFSTYCAATAMVLVLYVVLESWLSSEEPSPRESLRLGAVFLLIFLLHPQAFLYALITSVALLVMHHVAHGRSVVPSLRRLLTAMLPPLMLLTSYVVSHWGGKDVETQFFPTRLRFRALPIYAGAMWEDNTVYIIVYALVAVVALSRLVPDGKGEASSFAQAVWRGRYLVLMLLYVAGSVVLPEVYGHQHYMASRMVPMALLMLPMALSDGPLWHGRVLPAIVATLVAGLGLTLATDFLVFNVESRGFQAVIEFLPRASRYRCMVHSARSSILDMPVYDGFCSYVLVEKGGLAGPMHEHTGIRFQEPYRFSDEFDVHRDFDLREHGDRYEYFVVHASAPLAAFEPGGALHERVALVLENGPWRVYQRTRPFRD
ncbi:MAG: hypothetical protein AB2A00_10850 [Myxococcota bacterium]